MEYTKGVGSGESLCQSSVAKRELLNNIEVDLVRDLTFLTGIFEKNNVKGYRLELLPPKKHRWGTCFPDDKKVYLYKHTVNVLLHEYAHALTEETRGHGHGHDYAFASVHDYLVEEWWKYITNKTK